MNHIDNRLNKRIRKVKHVITNGSWKGSILLNSKDGIHQILFEFEHAKLKKCSHAIG